MHEDALQDPGRQRGALVRLERRPGYSVQQQHQQHRL